MSISFLQINLNRCIIAHDLLDKYSYDNNIDIVLVSEPNKNIASNRQYLTDENIDTAIIILQGNKIRIDSHLQGKGYVGMRTENTLIISIYISPNIPIQDFNNVMNDLSDTEKTVAWTG